MRKTKYTVKTTTLFKKDFKLAMKRGLNIELLENIIALLSMGEPLPEKNKDHALTGNWMGHRECHILPDHPICHFHRVNHFAQMNDHDIPVLEYAAPPVSGIPLKEKRRSMGMSVSDRCSQCFLLST